MTATDMFDSLREAIDAARDSMDEARENYRYYYGAQLPEKVLRILADRGQPIRWENEYRKIAAKIEGYKIQRRTEIKVIGRQIEEDRDVSHILTDILRTIPDSTDFYDQKDAADLDLLLAGFCVLSPEIVSMPQQDKFGKNEKSIKVIHLPYEECFFDPYSRRKDFLDARYFHRVCWMDKARLEQSLPESKTANISYDGEIDTFIPRPSNNPSIRQRALIVYSWFWEEGIIKFRVWDYHSLSVITEGESPYNLDRFPIAARSLYRDRGKIGSWHGLFRDVKPIQDSINFKLLRMTNLLGSHKLLMEADAVADLDEFLRDYSKDEGVALVEPGAITGAKIKDITNHAAIDKLMQLVIDDRRQAEAVIGFNDEALGMANNRMSAIAIEKRQSAGLLGLETYLEAGDKLDRDLYSICISMIQQFYDAEQIIQIVEPDKAARYFTINESENDGKKINRKNRLDIGRYDITLRTTPAILGSADDRYKQSTEIMKILSAVDPELAAAYLPTMIKAMDTAAADSLRELLEKRERAKAEAAQGQQAQAAAQIQQQSAQLELAKSQAQLKELDSRAIKNAASAKETLERAKYHGQYAAAQLEKK